MLNIEDLRILCTDETIVISQHALNRLRERNIKYDDVTHAILNGNIIEQYPTDYSYPSCLILGLSVCDKRIHVVAGLGDNKLWIITAYYPALDKWEDDYKTRKAVK